MRQNIIRTGAYMLTARDCKVERDVRTEVWAKAARGIPVNIKPHACGWLAYYPLTLTALRVVS